MDIRFLNYSQAPIVSPLHKPLIIDIYQYFKPNHIKQKFEQPSKDKALNQVDLQAFKIHSKPNILPIKKILKESG